MEAAIALHGTKTAVLASESWSDWLNSALCGYKTVRARWTWTATLANKVRATSRISKLEAKRSAYRKLLNLELATGNQIPAPGPLDQEVVHNCAYMSGGNGGWDPTVGGPWTTFPVADNHGWEIVAINFDEATGQPHNEIEWFWEITPKVGCTYYHTETYSDNPKHPRSKKCIPIYI